MAAAPGTTAEDRNQPLYGQSLYDFIFRNAQARHLDPATVLAVVPHEGGFQGAVGDSGSSFGPFQLHVGGALPSSIKDNPATPNVDERAIWANSPAGVNYALSRIKLVTPETDTGTNAIHDIVYKFERPANPEAEFNAAVQTYYRSGVDSADANLTDPLNRLAEAGSKGLASGVKAAGNSVLAPFEAAKTFFEWITNPKNIVRLGEIGLGVILLVLGLILVGRASLQQAGNPQRQLAGAAATAAGFVK